MMGLLGNWLLGYLDEDNSWLHLLESLAVQRDCILVVLLRASFVHVALRGTDISHFLGPLGQN